MSITSLQQLLRKVENSLSVELLLMQMEGDSGAQQTLGAVVSAPKSTCERPGNVKTLTKDDSNQECYRVKISLRKRELYISCDVFQQLITCPCGATLERAPIHVKHEHFCSSQEYVPSEIRAV